MKKELKKLVTKLEQKISSKYPLNLLMLVEREGYSNFRLLISSDTLKSNLTTNSFLSKELAKIISKEEFKILSGVEVVDTRSNFFTEMKDYLENNGNPEELYHKEFGGLKINRALIIIFPVDNSRKYVREAELRYLEKQLQDNVRLMLIQLSSFPNSVWECLPRCSASYNIYQNQKISTLTFMTDCCRLSVYGTSRKFRCAEAFASSCVAEERC
jgi:hypothetical protein